MSSDEVNESFKTFEPPPTAWAGRGQHRRTGPASARHPYSSPTCPGPPDSGIRRTPASPTGRQRSPNGFAGPQL